MPGAEGNTGASSWPDAEVPPGSDGSRACTHGGSPGTWEILPPPLEHPARAVWVSKTPALPGGVRPSRWRRQDAGGTGTRGDERVGMQAARSGEVDRRPLPWRRALVSRIATVRACRSSCETHIWHRCPFPLSASPDQVLGLLPEEKTGSVLAPLRQRSHPGAARGSSEARSCR